MFETGTYSHDSVKRWAKHVKGGDVFKLRLVFVPVALGSHWTLCVVDIQNKAKSRHVLTVSPEILYHVLQVFHETNFQISIDDSVLGLQWRHRLDVFEGPQAILQ
jgi:Ulp1 family protease